MTKKQANLFILGYLLLQAFLIVRCYFSDEKFFGWQMYSQPLVYRVRFFGTADDGLRKPLEENLYRPWFRGLSTGRFLTPSEKYRVSTRGKKFLLAEMNHVPDFLCRKLQIKGFIKIEIEADYRQAGEAKFNQESFGKECFP